MITLLKPFYNASDELEGGIAQNAIIIFAKRPMMWSTRSMPLVEAMINPGEALSSGTMMSVPVQWWYYLHIDLWIVKLQFYWRSKVMELP